MGVYIIIITGKYVLSIIIGRILLFNIVNKKRWNKMRKNNKSCGGDEKN